MFERIMSIFTAAPKPATLPERDAQHAFGALMVRAAKIDRAYLFEEVEMIDRILARLNGLNPVEAAKFRAACERLEQVMPDTGELAEIVHAAIPPTEAEAMVRALWQVVFADGVEHEEEDQLLHQIESVLGVAPDRARAIHDEVKTEMGR